MLDSQQRGTLSHTKGLAREQRVRADIHGLILVRKTGTHAESHPALRRTVELQWRNNKQNKQAGIPNPRKMVTHTEDYPALTHLWKRM